MVCSCNCNLDPTIVETLPDGWWTGEFRTQKGRYYDQVDPNTGLRYWHEPMCATALKCALLLVFIPIYLSIYVAWHVIRAPIVATVLSLRAADAFIRNPSKDHLQSLGLALIWEAPKSICKSIWYIVRAPFYAIAMEFAALYGVFCPTKARVWVGNVERQWHEVDLKSDIRYSRDSARPFLWNALTNPDSKNTFYAAFCMQPWGGINDCNIIETTRYYPGAKIDP